MNNTAKLVSWGLLVSVAILMTGSRVQAEGVGIRAGLSADPDQFYFGVHAESGPVIDVIRFRPNFEAGFGDNRTVVTLNGELIYPFELRNGTGMYVGGGPSIVIISRHRANGPNANNTDVEPGFNFLVGVNLTESAFAELKVGLIDSPEVKVGFG